jgi:hypothetical protein
MHDALAHTCRPLLATIAELMRPGGVRGVVRILVAKAPVAHQQPRAAAGAEPECVRSLRHGQGALNESYFDAAQPSTFTGRGCILGTN